MLPVIEIFIIDVIYINIIKETWILQTVGLYNVYAYQCLSSGSSRLQYQLSIRGGTLHRLPLLLLQTLHGILETQLQTNYKNMFMEYLLYFCKDDNSDEIQACSNQFCFGGFRGVGVGG